LNGFDVQGCKLRVEYKKVLQAGEKERIEREKAIRRMHSMQLEKEQHQHQATPQTPYDDFSVLPFHSLSVCIPELIISLHNSIPLLRAPDANRTAIRRPNTTPCASRYT
jgi:hypothetical protein